MEQQELTDDRVSRDFSEDETRGIFFHKLPQQTNYEKIKALFLPFKQLPNNVRCVRYAVRVTLAVLIASLFVMVDVLHDWCHGYGAWTIVTITLISQPSVGSSLNKFANRSIAIIIETIFVAIVLLFAFQISDSTAGWSFIIISVGVVTFFSAYLIGMKDYAMEWKFAFFIFMITFDFIVIDGYRLKSTSFVFWNFVCILIGALIAVVFDVCFFPDFARDDLNELCWRHLEAASFGLTDIVDCFIVGEKLEQTRLFWTKNVFVKHLSKLDLRTNWRAIVLESEVINTKLDMSAWELRVDKSSGIFRFPKKDVLYNYRMLTLLLSRLATRLAILDEMIRDEIEVCQRLRKEFQVALRRASSSVCDVLNSAADHGRSKSLISSDEKREVLEAMNDSMDFLVSIVKDNSKHFVFSDQRLDTASSFDDDFFPRISMITFISSVLKLQRTATVIYSVVDSISKSGYI